MESDEGWSELINESFNRIFDTHSEKKIQDSMNFGPGFDQDSVSFCFQQNKLFLLYSTFSFQH